MKPLALLLIVACLMLSESAFARGGMGSHMSMAGGGALGTSRAAPGTNSSGTALPSGMGGHVRQGTVLSTDATMEKEDARLQKVLEGSICRGC